MFAIERKTILLLLKRSSDRCCLTAAFHSQLSSLPPRPSLNETKAAHARLITAGLAGDTQLTGRLVAALALSPSAPLEYSRAIFNSIQNPTVFTTNNMIRCFAKSESPSESIVLYAFMRRIDLQPNNYTFPFVLQACTKAQALVEGSQVHCHVIKLGFGGDVYITNALVHFYSACFRIECSRMAFDESRQCRDVVTWNVMLGAYVRDGQVGVAEKMFEEMPERDVISWSIMITGFVQNGQLEEGLDCFREMREMGMVPNEAILVTALSASAQLGLLDRGRLIHSIISSLDFPMSVPIGTALIDMYSKCGCIVQARHVFNQMPRREVCSWNAMICGLAAHGLGEEALAFFERFRIEGFHPVNVTFIGVLNACSRAGLVNEGRHYFKIMTEEYAIKPEMEHYGCMVDLLGRAGFVAEAIELIEKISIQPNPVLWATLLGSCKIHGLVELGEEIGNKLIQLDPAYDGHYVQLAGIYAKARKWEDVVRIRRLMIDRGTYKVAGWSLVEAQGRVHQFIAGDREHERSSEIHKKLDMIGRRIGEAGYIPNVSPVLHDIMEEEKENVIKEHSERLAIAFGFLVSGTGETIRIVKNLRVCGDCHDFTKAVSKVFKREITVRDGSRFHHFKEGECSCLDYW
ncbi:hypothetical protein NMG60_11032491 [Bertholletia excelsa]